MEEERRKGEERQRENRNGREMDRIRSQVRNEDKGKYIREQGGNEKVTISSLSFLFHKI